MNTSNSNAQPRWYQIPMVWMVVGIPLFSVVFTLSIVWISIKTFDGLVVDDYYRKGLEINRDLERDRYASDINLVAFAALADGRLRIDLQGNDSDARTESIKFGFYHPTVANRDVVIDLQHEGAGRYSMEPVTLGHGKWNAIAETDAWRLVGTLFHPNKDGFTLKPVQPVNVSR